MSACVETMFSVREMPWHKQGIIIEDAPTSADAIRLAGLDWTVEPVPVYTENGILIPHYKANRRSSDGKILGIVSDRYQIIQNNEAFDFIDALLGAGITFETAGSLLSGKRVWLLVRLEGTKFFGEEFIPYLVFTNTHDGTGAVKVALVDVRVVCMNTLNLALSTAKRSWTCVHKGDIQSKLHEAEVTLLNVRNYQEEFEKELEDLKLARIGKDDVVEMIAKIIPIDENEKSELKIRRLNDQRDEFLHMIQHPCPDVHQGVQYPCQVALHKLADHIEQTSDRQTKSYNENLFMSVVDGNKIIDLSYALAKKKLAA